MRTDSQSRSTSAAAARSSSPSCRLRSLSSLGPGVVPGLPGLPHLARQLLDLGPHRFGLPLLGPPRRIGGDNGIDLGRLHPAPGQRGLDRIGFVSEQADIDHLDRK